MSSHIEAIDRDLDAVSHDHDRVHGQAHDRDRVRGQAHDRDLDAVSHDHDRVHGQAHDHDRVRGQAHDRDLDAVSHDHDPDLDAACPWRVEFRAEVVKVLERAAELARAGWISEPADIGMVAHVLRELADGVGHRDIFNESMVGDYGDDELIAMLRE